MIKIDSDFALLDVLGPDGELYELYKDRRGDPTPVVIFGNIVGVWGSHDGTSREFHVVVDEVFSMKPAIFFVLNGLLNGVEGELAIPAGGGEDPPLKDGWYWLVEGMDDGEGPYNSRAKALAAFRAHMGEKGSQDA